MRTHAAAGLEVQGQTRHAPVPGGEDVLHAGDALADGDAPQLGERQRRRPRAHPAHDDRHAQLAALRRVGLDALDRGTPPQHDARGEVLHLALAVDRRVGDDGHRLLEVVRERHGDRHEGAERSVPSQRPDRLGAAVGVELELLLVALDPPGRGEQGVQLEIGREQVLVGVLLHGDRLEAPGEARAGLGGGQGAAALGPLVDLALDLPVVEDHGCAVLAGHQGDLLAGGERRRVAGQLGHGDDARLGGDGVDLGGLHPPQRPQPHGVDREDHLVGGAAGEADGALRVGSERLAVMDVEVLELRREAVDLAQDRRKRELHGLEQREALLEDQALEQPVEVLAVGAELAGRQAELLALLAELGDRVDLAVVAEDRERLHPAEGRVGVRGIAVVGDDPRRREVGLGHLRVEPRDHLGLALHLVDDVVRRERGDVAVELLLDLDHGPVAVGRCGAARLLGQGGDLPEDRRGLRGARAEGAAVDRALSAPEHGEAVLAHDGLDPRHLDVGVLGGVEEDVGHREAPVVGRGGVEALVLEAAAPRGAGQIDEQPASVTLAVNAPGSVDHHLERRQSQLQHAPARLAVAGREGGQGAGVVLDQIREAAGRRGGERRADGHARASRSWGLRTR